MADFLLISVVLALTCGFVLAGMAFTARFIVGLVNQAVEKQNETLGKSLGGITDMLRDAVISTVTSTTQGVMVSLVGEQDKAVKQGQVDREGDLNHPDWTTWDDGDPDGQFADIGDSVNFKRADMDTVRVAGIEDGEAIIPGVPLPDMSGEGWQPAQ